MKKHKVTYLLRITEELLDIIRAQVPPELELFYPSDWSRESLHQMLTDTEFALVSSLDGAAIAAAPRLRLIQLSGIGFEKVDIQAARAAGITVASTPEGNVIPVAEHVMALVLAVYRRLIDCHLSLRRGEWHMMTYRHLCHELAGQQVGIVGLGRIGKAVAKRMVAFDARVSYFDTMRPTAEEEAALGVSFQPLETLLASCDVVTLHVPLEKSTERLLDRSRIAMMKPGAVLINTCRGPVVDEKALYEALVSGHLSGAGLDVFEREPPDPHNPLFQLDQVVLTPHCASGTRESHIEKASASFANMLRFLRGEPLRNVLVAGSR